VLKLSLQELHEKGWKKREEELFEEALVYLEVALKRAVEEREYEIAVDVLKDRCLVWKHLFLVSREEGFAVLAKKDAEGMLEIARKQKLEKKLGTSYFRLGEVAMMVGEFERAVGYYQQALEHYQGSLAEKGDYRYHLGEAMYRAGDKSDGEQMMLEGIEEIKKGAREVDSFLVNVWMSGGYMRLASCLVKDKKKKARKYWRRAKEIAEEDERLVIRRRQIEEMGERLGFA